MEAFKVFATMSLVDILTSPLRRIREGLAGTDGVTASLSTRLGRLALAMAPVALAAGVLLGGFAACVQEAIAFESAMADVAKVVSFDTTAELEQMGQTIKELAGQIPMAADGIAAIIAAAGQSGIAKADLVGFAEQAAKMGIAFDLTGDQAGKMMADWRAGMNLSLPRVYALADSINHLSNNMNASAPALGEVIQRVGALAMSCGLGETEVAALGAAFLSAGASPEIASTALKKFTSVLVSGTALSKDAAAAFSSLGFSATQMAKDMQTDAKGTIFKVLEALADKPKELQISLLKEMFGEEAIGAIAPLLSNMGNLTAAFGAVADASTFAGSMQAEFETRSKTAANALQLLKNKMTNLAISVGSVFLPVVSWGAEKLGMLADAVRWVIDTPFGKWLLKIVAAMSGLIIGVTAFSAAIWGMGKLGPLVGRALLPIKTAIMGLGWPILLIIGAVSLLYIAYQENFGGIADTLNRWWNNITLVFKGVIAIFKSLTGSTFELRGELARDIKAAGLEKLVVNVAKIVYRIRAFFLGIWEGIDFSRPLKILEPVGAKLGAIFERLGRLFSQIFDGEVTSASSTFTQFGQVVGGVVTFALEALATAVGVFVNALDIAIYAVEGIVALLNGDWQGACNAASAIWDTLVANLMSIADLFQVGDWLRAAWADATAYLSSINLFESGARILDTLKEGIMSKCAAVKETIVGFFSDIREYLPFSDAKKGPFSDLTLSGSRLMTTLAEGAEKGSGTLLGTVSGIFSDVSQGIGGWWDTLFSGEDGQKLTPNIPPVPVYGATETEAEAKQGRGRSDGNKTYTFHIGQIVLPNAKDGKGFAQELENAVMEYGGGIA